MSNQNVLARQLPISFNRVKVAVKSAFLAVMRGTAMAELDAMTLRFSQWLPGQEISEQHWMYRWAKKYWFNDFGAYKRG